MYLPSKLLLKSGTGEVKPQPRKPMSYPPFRYKEPCFAFVKNNLSDIWSKSRITNLASIPRDTILSVISFAYARLTGFPELTISVTEKSEACCAFAEASKTKTEPDDTTNRRSATTVPLARTFDDIEIAVIQNATLKNLTLATPTTDDDLP